jgi:hypothetical protein
MSSSPYIILPSTDDWRWRSFYDGTDWLSLFQTVVPLVDRLTGSSSWRPGL